MFELAQFEMMEAEVWVAVEAKVLVDEELVDVGHYPLLLKLASVDFLV